MGKTPLIIISDLVFINVGNTKPGQSHRQMSSSTSKVYRMRGEWSEELVGGWSEELVGEWLLT